MKEQAEEYRTKMIEQICELDDDLMMQYLEGEELDVQEMKNVLRKATCECTAVPVCCGSAYRNKGVQKLLDAILEYMPAPTDIPAIKGVDLEGNEVERHSSDDEPFAALAFKIMADPFVGKLAFFRVYSGTLNSGSYVLNATKDKKERVGRILQMHANKRMELDKVYSGDIAAAVGFKITTTGDTICDEQHPVILESMEFPEPVIELAIEPKTKAGQQKMGEALAKLAEEDPTFRAHTDQGDGPDHHRRYGRAASGDYRRQTSPRVQGGGKRRCASGCLQGDLYQTRGSGIQVRKAVRWTWTVRSL